MPDPSVSRSVASRMLRVLLVWEPLAHALWAWLRACDNRRKGHSLTLSSPWDYVWALVLYGTVNGHVSLSDIEREWRP